METVTLLYIIIAFLVALFLASFQYIFKRKEKSQLNYWLFSLRFLSLFLIFILFINPSIHKNQLTIEKPNLLVALDNSSSIKYVNQNGSVKKVLETLKENQNLNSKFNINYYSFGNKVQLLDSLDFNEDQTSISNPLEEFSHLYKNVSNPTIIVTDGNQTNGKSIGFINYKQPIYPFIVGDTAAVEDIYINQLNINEYTYINNKFPVELFMNYEGDKSVNKELAIYHKGKKISSQFLQFSKDKNVHNVSLFLSGNESGRQYYTARIEALENEVNTQNNSKTFSVNVVEEQSKILLLTALNHPDLGMFKKAIESNKQRSVDIKNINNINIEYSDYQLVIAYQPNKKFNKFFELISKEKINYFIVSGTNTDWSFLNEAQSVFQKENIIASENYLPKFNENYATFMADDIGFSSFAPLENSFGNITFSVPYQTLLFQKIGTIETEQPLLATFENFEQKGALLLGENSWRWRMNSFMENKSFELFDGFISNLIQYLASNTKTIKLTSKVEPIFYSNETVHIYANYLDKNLNINTKAKLWITISDKKNNYLNKLPLAFNNNRFEVDISNLKASEYSYTIFVENTNEKITGKFKVLPFQIEQQFSQSNDKDLKKLAIKTNGEIFYNNQEAVLIDLLLKDDRYKSIQKSSIIKTPLIEWYWLLGVIVLLLSLEWFIRKYYGKI